MTTLAYTGRWAWVNNIPVLEPACRAILTCLHVAVGNSAARVWSEGITSSSTIFTELVGLARNPRTTYAQLAYWLVDRKHWLRYIHQQELADGANVTAAAVKAETNRLLSLVRSEFVRHVPGVPLVPSCGVPGILWSRPATRHTEQHTLVDAYRPDWRFIHTLNRYVRAVGAPRDMPSPILLLRSNIWNGNVPPVEVAVAQPQPQPTLVAAPPAFPYRPSAKTY